VLVVAGQRENRLGFAQTFGDEERRDEVARREGRFGHESAYDGRATEAPRALGRKHVPRLFLGP